MDTTTLQSLQFEEVLRKVGEYCRSPLGRERVENARPASGPEEAEALLAPVREAMELMDSGQDLSLDGLGDPREVWDAMGPAGHSLDGPQLLEAANFLETVRRAEEFIREVRSQAPNLGRMGDGLTPVAHLELELRRAILPDGRVADAASPALANVRAELLRSEQRLRARVDRLATELSEKGILQDAYATVRNGRYVFPVRAAMKMRVGGIIHSSSNTGETYFIEPGVVVELSNELEELREAEAREVHRVLLALTDRLRPYAAQLRGDTERLAALDSVFGRAHAARRFGWAIPKISAAGPMRLHQAHHPLLHILDRDHSIGVNFKLEAGDRGIIISGPNAGGKTTLLKTIGLVALLIQSGVPAPLSPDSHAMVFTDIWTDIGDAQDVASGQSTFSAHARRMAQILKRARAKSLVLLDELGTATDPAEGAALARACLDALRSRGGLTIATSHLTPLKQWAHETHGVRNASFALDPKTRRPTFSLILDIPGASEAFVIAEREGIPEEILSAARRFMERGEADLTSLLRTLGARERTLGESEAELRRRLDALADQEEMARRRAESLREERRKFREVSSRDRIEHLAKLREEVETRIASLPAREAALAQQRAELSRARREVESGQGDAESELRRAQQSLPPSLEPAELAPGREVYVIDLHEFGQLRSLDAKARKAQVLLGRGLVVEVPIEGLTRSPDELPAPAPLRGVQAGAAAFDEHEDLADAQAPRKRSKKIKRQQEKSGQSHDSASSLDRFRLDWKRGGSRPAPRAKEADSAPIFPSGVGVVYARKPQVAWELDLHGWRVVEALEEVDKYLDDAVLADMPYVKICHGTGTGALSRALREFLAKHPHAAAWRYGLPEEGGAGVTIVDLR